MLPHQGRFCFCKRHCKCEHHGRHRPGFVSALPQAAAQHGASYQRTLGEPGSPAGHPASKSHRRVRWPLETQPVPSAYRGQKQARTQLLKSTYLPEAAESQRAKARGKMSASRPGQLVAGQHRPLRTGEQLLSHSCAAQAISSWGHWEQLGTLGAAGRCAAACTLCTAGHSW